MKNYPTIYYINSKCSTASLELGKQVGTLLGAACAPAPAAPLSSPSGTPSLPPVILCIGTDRVTGDSLGPLVGTFLKAYARGAQLPIYGTLETPVHALNLAEVQRHIKKKHPHNPIIAVDASLGTKKHLGYITLGQGSLQPGAGVQKNLAPVGDLFITGIVNMAVPEAQMALQNTRLSVVADLACCIAHGILYAFYPAALVAASYN